MSVALLASLGQLGMEIQMNGPLKVFIKICSKIHPNTL